MNKPVSTADQLTTYNQVPNFSIVLPGKCNANCKFCFWTEKSESPDWLANLKTILLNKPTVFRQVSVTGGEPCMSDQLVPVLKLLGKFKEAGHLDKIVLTTNGSGLLYKLSVHKSLKAINHINISRHSPNYEENLKIFNTDFIPPDQELREAAEIANSQGTDVTLNCVINKKTDPELIHEMIAYAKSLNASHVSFRKEYGQDLDPTPAEDSFKSSSSIEMGCPVCRTKHQLIDGMAINWKTSIIEPNKMPAMIKGKMVYEAIYHPDGILSCDWRGKQGIQFVNGFIFPAATEQEKIDEQIEELYEKIGISKKPAPKKIVKTTTSTASCGYPKSSGGGCGGGGGCVG